jgi:putative membrane protein
MMDGGMTGWGILGGVIGMVFMLALLTLVVLGIVWLVRSLTGKNAGSLPPAPSALEELDRRYARGELDREEYQQRRLDIEVRHQQE